MTLRIDKWLWRTRFFKTRSIAATAVKGGRVKLNGERAKPASLVGPGDRLQINRRGELHLIGVVGIPKRRGPPGEALSFYDEDAGSREQREKLRRDRKRQAATVPATRGRPDKHTRRRLIDLNRRG